MPPAAAETVRHALAALDDPDVRRAVTHELRLRDRENDYVRRRGAVEAAAAAAAPGPETERAQRVIRIVDEVHHNGFSIVHGFLEGDRLQRVRTGMEALMSPATSGILGAKEKVGALNVDNIFGKTRAADEVALDRLLRSLITGILGPNWYMSCGHAKCTFPGNQRQILHRDDGRFRFTAPHPHRPMVCNTLIALDEFTKENGGTWYIPGSHVWAAERKPKREVDQVRYLEMPAGSLFIFDGALFHAGGANVTTDRHRRTICLNYTPDFLRPIENHTLSVSLKEALDMPDELQADLGFRFGSTMLGNVEMQQPIDYMKKQAKL